MAATGQPNRRLKLERRKRGWSQVDVVNQMFKVAREDKLPVPGGLTDNYISRYERGVIEPSPHHVHLLCLAFELPSGRLGLPGDVAPTTVTMEAGGNDTERRTLIQAGAGAALSLLAGGVSNWLATQSEAPKPIVDPLAILEYRTLGSAVIEPGSLDELRVAVTDARRAYQACHYAELSARLPQLLARLNAARDTWGGDDRLTANALSAEAHHVAAGLLLKHEDHGPAWIVADRSMQAAERSGDPQVIASSARIITHVFMRTGHNAAAATTAANASQRYASMWREPTSDDLAIYGSLLLRGAVAAARAGNRDVAYDLLGEAGSAAKRVGRDDNRRWTAFGPLNVRLHQVHVAVRLGDAGTAIELARKIDLESVSVIERKASLLVDAAIAMSHLGRIEQSYRAVLAAESQAPEEIAGRPVVRQLVADLVVRAPSRLVPGLKELVARVGATALLE